MTRAASFEVCLPSALEQLDLNECTRPSFAISGGLESDRPLAASTAPPTAYLSGNRPQSKRKIDKPLQRLPSTLAWTSKNADFNRKSCDDATQVNMYTCDKIPRKSRGSGEGVKSRLLRRSAYALRTNGLLQALSSCARSPSNSGDLVQ